ncbi:MAG: hypothetical protein IIC61_10185 [Proteobacteria bacterium]|nr:hypothetical protein [Pseudomonadota bacterium]
MFIPVDLAILALEFAWARLWLKRLCESISRRNMRRTTAGAMVSGRKKRKEPEKPNSLLNWRVGPTRNDPRLLVKTANHKQAAVGGEMP